MEMRMRKKEKENYEMANVCVSKRKEKCKQTFLVFWKKNFVSLLFRFFWREFDFFLCEIFCRLFSTSDRLGNDKVFDIAIVLYKCLLRDLKYGPIKMVFNFLFQI